MPILSLPLLMGVGSLEAHTPDRQNASTAWLTVTKTGSGSGRIISGPPGIDCGSDCAELFPQGTEVRLTAVPGEGSEFGGWSGPTDCLDGVVTVTADTLCTGAFAPCSIPTQATVTGTTVNGRKSYHACNKLTVGPSVVVAGTGRADFTAGNDVVFVAPTTVQGGARMSVHIGSSHWAAKSGRLGYGTPGHPEDTGQDAYDFQASNASTLLRIEAAPDPNIDPEIYLYAPGAVGQGETNLLTGTPFGFDVVGMGAAEIANITVSAPGVYTLAIEDSRFSASQVAGRYTLVINSDEPIGPLTLVVDEGPESD